VHEKHGRAFYNGIIHPIDRDIALDFDLGGSTTNKE